MVEKCHKSLNLKNFVLFMWKIAKIDGKTGNELLNRPISHCAACRFASEDQAYRACREQLI